MWILAASGRPVTSYGIATAAIVVAAVLVRVATARLARRRYGDEDPYRRYWLTRLVTYACGAVAFIALVVMWAPLGGRASTIIGFATAGVAFAMQQVIGAVFGWVNILFGHVFRVGDRVEMAGVRGDVIDLTPMRTKILEIGQPGPAIGSEAESPSSWVHGRQYTGRIVTVSNQETFSNPVYNYSSSFEYIWEELTLPIPYRADWRAADRILLDEAQRVSRGHEAQAAMREMVSRYPVPHTEVEPRVFVRLTDNWVELTARFVVDVRTARSVKDEMARRLLDRLDQAGIEVASATSDVTVSVRDGRDGQPVPKV